MVIRVLLFDASVCFYCLKKSETFVKKVLLVVSGLLQQYAV